MDVVAGVITYHMPDILAITPEIHVEWNVLRFVTQHGLHVSPSQSRVADN